MRGLSERKDREALGEYKLPHSPAYVVFQITFLRLHVERQPTSRTEAILPWGCALTPGAVGPCAVCLYTLHLVTRCAH